MRTQNIIALAAVLALTILATACGPQGDNNAPVDPVGTTGLALTTDILDDTDVGGMAYTITGVNCSDGTPLDPALVIEETRELEDLLLPGGNEDLAKRPFDAASGHLFADAYFWLPEGCYDVSVQPIQEGGEPSEDCAVATQDRVAVLDGQTTEILLINQCANDGAGGLDVIAAVNHAPQIDDVSYDPSKFTCEDQTSICVTVSDPDNDPIQVTWNSDSDGAVIANVETVSLEEGGIQSCASIEVSGPGDYQISFTAHDQAYNSEGELVTIESILEAQGDGQTSNDTIKLPVHAMSEDACVGECACPDGFDLSVDGETCERITQTAAVQNGDFRTVCRGDQNENYGAFGATLPGGAHIVDSFFGNGTFDENNGSRLNTIGIWSCDGALREWIGFSRCIDVEESGEYVVGVSGDDRVRFSLNGDLVFEGNTDFHFRNWWMVPVTLQAGINIIEMEGYDQGVVAAFGAEIYGPFPIGSTVDDATMAGLDYENNIIWTTGDQLESTFNLGTSSGFSCEDGFALDLCSDEATCTRIEREACE